MNLPAGSPPLVKTPTRYRGLAWALALLLLGGAAFAVTFAVVRLTQQAPAEAVDGMVRIPGGEFTMGTDSDLGWADEKPAHRVRVDGFWMDQTEVTNAQFRGFVEATGYRTTAERRPDWEEMRKQLPPGTARPPESKLVQRGGSFLCDDSYRSRYRPGARRGCSPDIATSHVGFRCVRSR